MPDNLNLSSGFTIGDTTIYTQQLHAMMMEDLIQETPLLYSNAVTQNLPPALAQLLNGDGFTAEFRMWQRLQRGTGTTLVADTEQAIAPKGIGTTTQRGVLQSFGETFSASAFASVAQNGSPEAATRAIASDIAGWLGSNLNMRVYATLDGMINSSLAESSEEFHLAASIAETTNTANVGTANLMSKNAMLATIRPFGIVSKKMVTVVMHPDVHYDLRVLENRQDRTDSELKSDFDYFDQFKIILDDTVTIQQASDSAPKVYRTYFFAPNALAYRMTNFNKGMYVQYEPKAGNNAGADILYLDKKMIIHPNGFSCIKQLDGHIDYSDLNVAANWQRVANDRRLIGVACLESNASS